MAMRCPICKKPMDEPPATSSTRAAYPFCSERCRLIDLGRWLSGKYQIPVRGDEEEDLPPAEPEAPDDQ